MSDHNQLARTGTGAVVVIGGTAITGFWLLTVAVAIVAVGALLIRFGFRRNRSAGQR